MVCFRCHCNRCLTQTFKTICDALLKYTSICLQHIVEQTTICLILDNNHIYNAALKGTENNDFSKKKSKN